MLHFGFFLVPTSLCGPSHVTFRTTLPQFAVHLCGSPYITFSAQLISLLVSPYAICWATERHFVAILTLSWSPPDWRHFMTHLTQFIGSPQATFDPPQLNVTFRYTLHHTSDVTLWPTLRHFVAHLTALCGPPCGTLWPTLRRFVAHLYDTLWPTVRHIMAHLTSLCGTPCGTLWPALRHL